MLVVVTVIWYCFTQPDEEDATGAKMGELRSTVDSSKALLCGKAICLQGMLEDSPTIEENLESGKILLPLYCDLLHIDLARVLESVEAGLKVSTQGSSLILPKVTPSMVRDSNSEQVEDSRF